MDLSNNWFRLWKRLRFTHDLFQIAQRKAPPIPDTSQSLFTNLDEIAAVEAIRESGLYDGIELPEDVLNAILAFTDSNPMNGGFGDPKQAELQFFREERLDTIARTGENLLMGHYANISKRSEIIRRLEKDPKIIAIASRYFGNPPASVKTMLWWSFATNASTEERLSSSQTVLFHFDEFDYRFLYFSFYLTDVDESAGAHVCVKKSHNRKGIRFLFSTANQSDEAIENFYGKENIVTLTGKAGSGFVEDAFAFHKATPPQSRDRLFLQIRLGSSHRGQ